jgi:predicted small secreted protein
MKNSKLLATLLIATAVVLASCSNGGDIGDGTLALATSPGKIEIKSPYCSSVTGPKVTVYGGVPPYSIKNPYPKYIQLDKEYLLNAGEGFTATIGGSCLTTIPLFIYDSNGNTLEFMVSLTDSVSK